MTELFYTLEQIAKACRRPRMTIKRWAAAQGWRYEEIPSRSRHKKRRYPASTLPLGVREAVAIEQLKRGGLERSQHEVHTLTDVGSNPTPASTLPLEGRRRDRAEARRAIVQTCADFINRGHLPGATGTAAFAKLYNAGEIKSLPAEVKAAVPHLCANSIANWRRRLAREGVASLAGRHGRHRKGKGVIESSPELKDYIVGNLAHRPHLDAAQIIRGLRARYKDSKLPSYRSVQRFIAGWKVANAGLFLAVTDPDAHRSRLAVAFGKADDHIVAVNQLWEWDATPADVMCADGRHALVGVVDVWTRRGKVVVTPTSRATAITAVLRKAALAWGLPTTIKGDNGNDFTSFHVTRAMGDLHIRFIPCPPYTPEEKPHIERFFGTLSSQFLELLPGYIGHSVAERQAIRNRRSFAERREKPVVEVGLTAAELQARIDAWVDDVYCRQRHDTLKCSPFEKAAAWRGAVSRVADERALDVLLAEAPDRGGVRVVGKKGIALDDAHFIAPELGEWVGRRVHVRYDAADIGRVYVFAPDNHAFVAVAECPERTGIDRQQAAIEAKRRQRAMVKQGRAELRRLVAKVKPETIAEEILAAGRREAEVVTAFPHPSVAHETPALAAAAEAASAGEPRQPAAMTPVEAEAWEDVQAGRHGLTAAAEVVELHPEPLTDAEFVRRVMERPEDFEQGQRDYALELLGVSASLCLQLEITEEEGRRRITAGGPLKKLTGESACTRSSSARQTSTAS